MSTWRTFIVRPGQARQPVENLGWLLRHRDQIKQVVIRPARNHAVVMVAQLNDNTVYVTFWADSTVCAEWVGAHLLRWGFPTVWVFRSKGA